MIEIEKIAHEAASRHSRCAQCNGINHDTGSNCDKSRMYVCNLYWAGYYTALDALASICEQLEFPITEVVNENRLGLKETIHFVQTLKEYATSEDCGRVEVNKPKATTV